MNISTHDGSKPTPREIRNQLGRLLASRTFADAFNQAYVLNFIVIANIGGDPLDEDTIGKAIFPGYEPDISNDVRVTAVNLRKRLAKYYVEEGHADLVIIEVLKGRSYKIKCEYNSRAEAVRHYLLALDYLSNIAVFPDLFGISKISASRCTSADEEFAPGYSLQAEIELFRAAYLIDSPRGRLSAASHLAHKAEALDTSLWRAHVALGACRLCGFEWEQAQIEFKKAHDLSPEHTENDPWYVVYLAASRQIQEALLVARRQAKKGGYFSIWNLLLALILFIGGDNQAALDACVLEPLSMSSIYLYRLILACIEVAYFGHTRDGEKLTSLEEMDAGVIRYQTYPFRGLHAMFAREMAILAKPRKF